MGDSHGLSRSRAVLRWSSDSCSELWQQLASTSGRFTVDHLGVSSLIPRPMALWRQRQSRSLHRTCQSPRQGQGSSRIIGDQADHLPALESGRLDTQGSRSRSRLPARAAHLSRDRACPRTEPARSGPPRHLPRPARPKHRRPRRRANPSRRGSSPKANPAGSGPPRHLPRPARPKHRRPRRPRNRAAEGRAQEPIRQEAGRPGIFLDQQDRNAAGPGGTNPSRRGSRSPAFRRPSARGERTGVPPPSRSRSTPTTSGWRGQARRHRPGRLARSRAATRGIGGMRGLAA